MAITAPMKTSDFAGLIPPHIAAAIFDDAARVSAFQRIIPRIPLAASGETVPVITNKPTANWAVEAGRKHTSNIGFSKLAMEPKKLTAISVMSTEVVRANPGNVSTQLRNALAEAFAVAFDYAVGHGKGGDGTGSGPFEHNLAEATKSIEIGTTTKDNGGVHGDFAAALKLMVADKKKLTGWALDSAMEPILWGATDNTGRPLYVDLPMDEASQALQEGHIDVSRPGRLLNRPSSMGDGVGADTVRGFFGDFTKAAWGAVGAITYRVSTEASVTINGQLTSLFENNLVAVLAEAEYGFVMQSADFFGKLTDAA